MVTMDEAAMGEAWTKLHDGANPTNYILFGYVSRRAATQGVPGVL
jgi:hypothetical protein